MGLSAWDVVGVTAILIVLVGLLFSKQLFGRTRASVPEHAVLVTIPLIDPGFGSPEERERLRSVMDDLDRAIKASRAGEFDGDEFGEGTCKIYMYGPDADALFNAVEPVLRARSLPAGSRAVKRYGRAGDPNAREKEIPL